MIYFSDRDVVSKLAACGFLPLIATLLGKPEQSLKIRYLASLKYSLSRPSKKLANKAYQLHLEKFCQSHRSINGTANLHREQELFSGSMDPGEAVLPRRGRGNRRHRGNGRQGGAESLPPAFQFRPTSQDQSRMLGATVAACS